jgi:hypothetical protein
MQISGEILGAVAIDKTEIEVDGEYNKSAFDLNSALHESAWRFWDFRICCHCTLRTRASRRSITMIREMPVRELQFAQKNS